MTRTPIVDPIDVTIWLSALVTDTLFTTILASSAVGAGVVPWWWNLALVPEDHGLRPTPIHQIRSIKHLLSVIGCPAEIPKRTVVVQLHCDDLLDRDAVF